MTGGAVFDAHLHIVDPRFPLLANQGYVPAPFTVDDYRARTAGLGVVGGAVVSGSFQADDQAYLLAALRELGPGFVGVTDLPRGATDDELRGLRDGGVRAVRFNLHRGGMDRLVALEAAASRVWALVGWHVEVYVDGRQLPALEERLIALPRVSVDHLGMHAGGLPSLLRLVAAGVKVKASGFGRAELDVAAALRAIADVDPGALLFGTDLPGTRSPRPFGAGDLRLLRDVLGEEGARLALHDNAVAWYRPG